MSDLRRLLIAIGTRTSVTTLLVGYVATTVFFFVTISIFDQQFANFSGGGTLIDRQGWLTPDAIAQQIALYPAEARPTLWSFFILDNMLPQLLSFISAVLLVRYWTRHPNRIYDALVRGYWMLLPLGAGISDWMENLFLLSGVMLGAQAMSPLNLWGAALFHNVKLVLVGALGISIVVFTLLYIVFEVRRLLQSRG